MSNGNQQLHIYTSSKGENTRTLVINKAVPSKARLTIQDQYYVRKHLLSGITDQTPSNARPEANRQTRRNTPRRRPYAPNGLGGGTLPGFFPDVAVRRTRMPVRRTSPSTRHDEMTQRPADVPLGDGDSDRGVAQPRSGWLYPLHRRQRRYDSTAGRRSRFWIVPRTDRQALTTIRQALLPLQTTASSRLQRRPTVPVSVRPADRSALTPAVAYDGDLVVSRRTLAPGLVRRANAAPCVLLATALEPQFPATSGGSTHRAKLPFASHSLADSALSHSAHTVEP